MLRANLATTTYCGALRIYFACSTIWPSRIALPRFSSVAEFSSPHGTVAAGPQSFNGVRAAHRDQMTRNSNAAAAHSTTEATADGSRGPLSIRLGNHQGDPVSYRIAGVELQTDFLIPRLSHYRSDATPRGAPIVEAPAQTAQAILQRGERVYRSNSTRHFPTPISVHYLLGKYLVDAAGAGRFLLTPADGTVIRFEKSVEGRGKTAITEVVLGPLLLPLLAWREILCLHASAVNTELGCFAFLGQSGAGKSTLAAYLDKEQGFSRTADDVLPVRCDGKSVLGLSGYPQLKLGAPCAEPNSALSVSRIFLLDRVARRTAIDIRELHGRDALKHVMSHVVASRAFGTDLMQVKLRTCAEITRCAQVYRVTYSSGFNHLAELASELASWNVQDAPMAVAASA